MATAPTVTNLLEDEMAVFVEEADELLRLLEHGFLRLERDPRDATLLAELFRAAHTLKSSSAMVGLADMSELTHAIEDFFEAVRAGRVEISPAATDILLASIDALKEMKGRFSAGEPVDVNVSAQVGRLSGLVGGKRTRPNKEGVAALAAAVEASPPARGLLEDARPAGQRPYSVLVEFDEPAERAGVRCLQTLHALEGSGVVIASVPSLEEIERGGPAERLAVLIATDGTKASLRADVESAGHVRSIDIRAWRARPARRDEQSKDAARTMRVDIERLDGLMNTVGELVVDRTRLGELTRVLQSRYGHDDLVRDLCDTSAHLVRMVEELNDGMCSVRMVPIATLFATFPRLVRDLARQTGKDIEFTIDGEETELDRAVIDQIRDALVHVLRNAVDHGIEPPAERRAAGKAPAGTVRVAAHHEGGRIVVSVQDDGRGIDPQLVRSRAVEQGIVSAQAAGRMSDREGIELVYESGLSTSDEVTQTSGRGVGMDVVRRSVSGVGGLIDIESAPGLGTTVTLRLPLTLATFEALLVRSRATVFAIPLGYVQETAKLRPGVADTIMGAEVLRLRDEVMPLVRLGDGGGDERPETNGQGAVVIVRAGERALALAVDALLDQREVVAKPLQAIGSCEGISGTSVLGDGSVALILDTGALIARAAREHGEVELGGTSA